MCWEIIYKYWVVIFLVGDKIYIICLVLDDRDEVCFLIC